jgi:hypothetical protein
MPTTNNPILIRFGGAQKSSFSMNANELNQAASSILRRAKEKAFYKGLPVYFSDKGKIMAEYPDGRIEVAKISNYVSRTIRHSRPQRNR